ncbi:MAG TPA: tetratricopeptide repeat protein [Beijerinckiaceae bacterium]
MRNFGFSLVGGVQQFITNCARPAEFGLPAASEPLLPSHKLSEAFEGGEPNLFQALRWDYGLVETLYGREEDEKAILGWAKGGTNAASVRLVTGEGGAGKTRLGAAVARKLKGEGWTAGFLPQSEAALFEVGDKGLFLILDYPEEQAARTKALFRKLAEWHDAPYPIRLLLLSRRPFAEWEPDALILEGRFGRQAVAMPGSLPLEMAEALVKEAAANFARSAGKLGSNLSDATEWLSQSDIHRLPLFAAAAAIHAVLEPDRAFGIDAPKILHYLAERERRRVREISEARGLGKTGLERLLALGVLGDGLSESAVRELGKAGIYDGPAQDPVTALAETPWWRRGRLIRLQPDRPAAAFLDEVFFDSRFPSGPEKLLDWLFIATAENASTFADRLGRILFDLDILNPARRGPHPLDDRLIDMLRAAPDRGGAFIEATGREPPFHVARFAAEVVAIRVSTIADPDKRAGLLNNLANLLSALGRKEEALTRAKEAVALRRDLARTHPEDFTPNLAIALGTLAGQLSDLGQIDEALAVAEEGVALHRELARTRPEAFTRDLAASLSNIATKLDLAGRSDEALARAEEAVALYRGLAQAQPEAFMSELATSINTLANSRSNLGQTKEALAAAKEAVALYSDLARARPETFTPKLAGSLNNLANRLCNLGRHEEALVEAAAAIALYRNLARGRSEAFTPDLAMSLNNIAVVLAITGRGEEALAHAEEAVALRRELAQVRPEVFEGYLAGSLNNLASILSDLGRSYGSIAPAEEAVALYRNLACERPEAFRPNLAKSLHNLARFLSGLGRNEDALAPAEEAVALRRVLTWTRPEVFATGLIRSLEVLVQILSDLHRGEDAERAHSELLALGAEHGIDIHKT